MSLNLFKRLALAMMAVASSAAIAAATLPDTSYKPRLELTGSPSVLAVQPDGKSLVAGDFTTLNGTGRYQLGRINNDGSVDTSFVPSGFEALSTGYFALAVQPDGKILVGGQLWWMTPEGVSRQYLARLNSSGSLDTTFHAGTYVDGGLDGPVRAITIQADGQILIGGEFTRVRGGTQGVQRAYLARLNSDGSADSSFDPGTGANALVRSIAVQPNGSVLAAGDFTSFNGASRGHVARLLASGTLDSTFAPAANGGINAVAVQPDGRVVIGGDFTMVGSQGRQNVARVNADGSLDAWSTPFYFWSVKTVLALSDNSILVGGWRPGIIFNGWPTDHDAHVVKYASDGTALSSQWFDGKPTEVLAMARRPDGHVIVAGSFVNIARVQGQPVDYCHGLVLLTESLSRATGFNAVAAKSATVTALLDRGAGKVLVGGSFNLVNGVASAPLAQLNADGSLDPSFNVAGLTGAVTAAVALPDGSLAVAGSFRSSDGTSPGSVLHLAATGSLNANSSNIYAYALAVSADGKIYLGGSADASFRGVVRLNAADWSVDSTFAVGSGLSNSVALNRWVDYVNTMTVQSDGKLLLAGQFDQFNGSPRSNVVRLNTDGSVDASFTPPVLTSMSQSKLPEVFAVVSQADGKVLTGGYFQGYGANGSAPGLLRLNADGSVDTGFTPASIGNMGGEVRKIVIEPSGKLIAGGGFQVFEGNLFFNYFVRLNSDGSRDTSLAPSFSGSQVTQILISSGRILVGGAFYLASGEPSGGLAAFTSGISVATGWNLLGNSTDQTLNPVTLFGDKTNPTALTATTITVWAWDAVKTQWAFFAPSMTTNELASYAQSKGYLVLQSIAPRQGFWLNSKSAASLPAPTGNAVTVTTNDLVNGWNLMSDARGLSASAFHTSLGSATANYTTLWAWDPTQAGWLFHAPTLEANGSLASYIVSKGYLNFTTTNRKLESNSGFWINRP